MKLINVRCKNFYKTYILVFLLFKKKHEMRQFRILSLR